VARRRFRKAAGRHRKGIAMGYYRRWAPYVSVAQRRHRAFGEMARLRKKGVDIQPITIEGRKITKTFWGQAWCDHMESLGDFDNRLPRGRTYVRNGSVCHLAIDRGQVTAMVSGSSIYDIKVEIDVLPKTRWNQVKARCAGQIGSLLELLRGHLSDKVLGVVTDSSSGLFPLPQEIRLGCSCPDWAIMCKHVAAVLYGVGARLDEQPDLLFLLRGVKHEELITADTEDAVNRATRRGGKRRTLASGDLSDVFGIELDSDSAHNGDSADSETPTMTEAKRSAARKKEKGRPVVTRRKKSKIGTKAASKSGTEESAAGPTKKKVSHKKSVIKNASKKTSRDKTATTSTAKKKVVSKKSPKGLSTKTATKPNSGRAKNVVPVAARSSSHDTLRDSCSPTKSTRSELHGRRTSKKTTPGRPRKKNTKALLVKNSAAKKPATKSRSPAVKKTATRKKAASKV